MQVQWQYALKQNFMKIEIENSIRILSFLCHLPDIKIAWINPGKDVYVNSFFPRTVRLWNSLPIECFPLTYDLNGFKSRINRHLLTAGSF